MLSNAFVSADPCVLPVFQGVPGPSVYLFGWSSQAIQIVLLVSSGPLSFHFFPVRVRERVGVFLRERVQESLR